jgi:hypothetical protein
MINQTDAENQIFSFAKTHSSAETRKEIGRVFGLKKSARNRKFNRMFGAISWEAGTENGEKVVNLKRVVNDSADRVLAFGRALGDAARGKKPKVEVKGDKATVEVKDALNIKTVDDLLSYAQIDLTEWNVVKQFVNVWDGKYQVKAELARRKDNTSFRKLVEELKEDALNYSPNVDKILYKSDDKGLLLEICCFDLHLGKMGWAPSDGGDWDINIAKETFKNAVVELTEKARKIGNISKICFPIGNDYLTCDNSNNTTYASTPQSVDSRFPKVFKEGRKLLVWAIDYLKQFAPVDVVYVVSNHDTDSMFHLADALECWYRNDENVTVENSPAPRKYYRFKNNLIIYDHGDKVKFEKLPTVASVEYPEWSLVKNREFHVGHIHHEKSYRLDNADYNSAIIRVIPALSGSDYYHNSNGYVGAKQRAQAFVWHPENGLETILYSKSVN